MSQSRPGDEAAGGYQTPQFTTGSEDVLRRAGTEYGLGVGSFAKRPGGRGRDGNGW